MMFLALQLLRVFLFLSPIVHSVSAVSSNTPKAIKSPPGSKAVQHDDFLSTPTPAVFPSSKCWLSAAAIFAHVQDANDMDAAKICGLLPEREQKWLALEISRCHLQDLGKSLAENPDACDYWGGNGNFDAEASDLDRCLRSLTEAGVNAYTHYVSYVQQLCIRLTQEVLLHQQHVTQTEISSQYALISGQSLEQMKVLQSVAQSHTDQMKELSDIPQKVKHQLTETLQKDLTETLQASIQASLQEQLAAQLAQQLDVQLTHILQDQALDQATFMTDLMHKLESRDQDHQERYEMWTHYQTSLWQNQAAEAEKQNKKLMEQRLQIEFLTETVSKASYSIQPLVGLQAMINGLGGGFRLALMLIVFVMNWNTVKFLTKPSRCSGSRNLIHSLVLLELIAEASLLLLELYAMIESDARVLATAQLRRVSIAVEIAIYFAAVVWSFISSEPSKCDEESSTDYLAAENQRIRDQINAQLQTYQKMGSPPMNMTSIGTRRHENQCELPPGFLADQNHHQHTRPVSVSPVSPQHLYLPHSSYYQEQAQRPLHPGVRQLQASSSPSLDYTLAHAVGHYQGPPLATQPSFPSHAKESITAPPAAKEPISPPEQESPTAEVSKLKRHASSILEQESGKKPRCEDGDEMMN